MSMPYLVKERSALSFGSQSSAVHEIPDSKKRDKKEKRSVVETMVASGFSQYEETRSNPAA